VTSVNQLYELCLCSIEKSCFGSCSCCACFVFAPHLRILGSRNILFQRFPVRDLLVSVGVARGENGRKWLKNTSPIFTFTFFSRTEMKMGMSETVTDGS
jgi:hypothetical protein